ncbi:MAG: ABC transporter substrate-binding protein [Oscillospiraceae bacterium]
MKHTKSTALALTLLLTVALFSGCTAEKPSADVKTSVVDMMGREVSLEAPAKKIVALTAADCEILYALGAGDTLVGRGSFCDYPEAVTKLPELQSGSETNIEQIIALKPELVLMSSMAQTKEQVAAIEAAGIKTAVSEATDIAGVYKSIEIIGALTGRANEASDLVYQMKASFEALSANAAGGSGKTVYFEVSPLEFGLWTSGAHTFMDEIAAMLGLKNAFADVEGWAEISQEQVIERNPDYIVTISPEANGASPLDEIRTRKGWENMKAIKNDKLFAADPNEISRPGPRLTNAAQALSDFVYGGK